ncbi:XrtA-associated tyrosine autokinase [Caldimonas brevitalea]|uniref:non-specific protein-tyrosine kinase n=1 Tax=Caldimonas brevitalea TaxID=413882 RepID=A0A0G3BKJ8_9BURK|nr:XrtA-associated tyrosine autokinase [Caldimonas brevitalea]AKJ29907.1 protein tyrosine kinase [Caldimonas brevitalea]
MSIIEKAARRLEELRRAGVEVPWAESTFAASGYVGSEDALEMSFARAPLGPAGAPAGLARVAPAPAVERRSREVVLDLDRLARAGYLVPGEVEAALADEFRVIKRPLIKNAQGESAAPIRRANLILVTSAMPGEGKTFCAINLALSLAMEVDKKVLLVDADVVRPAVMGRLGLGMESGLLDVLKNPQLDLSEVMLRTNVPKLSLLPTGAPGPHANELLASAAMERLLDELATRYADRIIVFDAPPLLPTTESRVLASRVGQVVMVVEAGRTTRPAVAEAFAALESCPVVMSVLNKTRVPAAVVRYGY